MRGSGDIIWGGAESAPTPIWGTFSTLDPKNGSQPQNLLLNFAQNFRKCLFNLAGSESGEKSNRFENFAYISQLFVYKIHIWT